MIETLLDRAEGNLRFAKHNLKIREESQPIYLNFIGYYIQQSVEYALKHLHSVYGINYPGTNDITILSYSISKTIQIEVPISKKDMNDLTRWYSSSMYLLDYYIEFEDISQILPNVEYLLKYIRNLSDNDNNVKEVLIKLNI